MSVRLLTSVAALALSAGTAMADYSLTILHTNDFHDRFEPISKYDSTCGEEDNAAGECFGGVARLVTAIADQQAMIEGDSLLLDAGDMFQGSLFFTEYAGDLAADVSCTDDSDCCHAGATPGRARIFRRLRTVCREPSGPRGAGGSNSP